MYCIYKLRDTYFLKIIEDYAPTREHSNEVTKDFYDDVSRTIQNEKCYYQILIEDYSANVRSREVTHRLQ